MHTQLPEKYGVSGVINTDAAGLLKVCLYEVALDVVALDVKLLVVVLYLQNGIDNCNCCGVIGLLEW